MTSRLKRRRRRVSLRGSLRLLPFLILPFAVLFFETWLHTQTLRNGYETTRLQQEIKATQERLNQLEDRIASLNRMEIIEATAPELGLVEPDPDKVHIIYVEPGEIGDRHPFELAQVPPTHDTGGADRGSTP